MELKEDDGNPRANFHLHRKLKKAVRWSEDLLNLCSELADDRTKLEAEAYAGWMAGNLHFHQEKWKEALECFDRARKIYNHLGKVGHSEYQEMFRQRVEEIEPNIRFCKYNLGIGEETGVSELKELSHGATSDILQEKLDKVLAETRKKHAESMREITWGKQTIPVKSDKLREHILKAQESAFEIEKEESTEAKLALYDKVFVAYNDAANCLRDELRQFQDAQKKSLKQQGQEEALLALKNYVEYCKLSRTIDRNLLMVQTAGQKLQEVGDGQKQQTGKAVKPKDLVKLYDTLLQNMRDISELQTDDPEFSRQVAARLLCFKAYRCYYVALTHFRASKWPEALALFERTSEHIASALAHYQQCTKAIPADVAGLAELEKKIKGKTCAAHAKAFLETTKTDAAGSSSTAGEAAAEGEKESQYSLLRAMDTYDATGRVLKERRVVDFPPELQPIPCKPILFDLALSSIQAPSLDARKKAKKGFFSFWRS
ncbi:signal recognition particle subunit srp68 [Balamuthia mandrillaris]